MLIEKLKEQKQILQKRWEEEWVNLKKINKLNESPKL